MPRSMWIVSSINSSNFSSLEAAHFGGQGSDRPPQLPFRGMEGLAQRFVGAGGDPELERGEEERPREALLQQVEESLDPVFRVREPLRVPPELFQPSMGEMGDRLDDEILPLREVVLLRATRHARSLGDALRRRSGVALVDQALDRRVEDPSPGLGRPLVLRATHARSRGRDDVGGLAHEEGGSPKDKNRQA